MAVGIGTDTPTGSGVRDAIPDGDDDEDKVSETSDIDMQKVLLGIHDKEESAIEVVPEKETKGDGNNKTGKEFMSEKPDQENVAWSIVKEDAIAPTINATLVPRLW